MWIGFATPIEVRSMAHADPWHSVLAITPVDTIDEAVELANDSEYTLVASLWTTNVHHAFEVAARIRAGELLTNRGALYRHASSDTDAFILRVCQHQWFDHDLRSWRGSSRTRVRRTLTRSAQSDLSDLLCCVIQRNQRLWEIQRGELHGPTLSDLACRA